MARSSSAGPQSRADVIRADLDRIRGMSDAEFEEKWGDWAREQDRSLDMVRRRWVEDLEYALPFAEAEAEALPELEAAKDEYRPVAKLLAGISQLEAAGVEDKLIAPLRKRAEAAGADDLKAARDDAAERVQDIRRSERAGRPPRDPKGFRVGGDAYVTGG